jgi:hypothetical protein
MKYFLHASRKLIFRTILASSQRIFFDVT